MFSTQYQNIWLNTQLLQLFYRMLRRFGLVFFCSRDIRYISKMYAYTILSQFPFQLAHAFDKRKRFDITDRTSDFSDHEIKFVFISQQFHIALDLVRDMRHHLHSLSQVIPFTFFVNNALINAACSDIICTGRLNIQETLVVSEIQIRFMSVYGNIAFPMFVWVQRTWIDIDIGIKFLNGNFITSCLK